MKFILSVILILSFNAVAQPENTGTGTKVQGPGTMGQGTYLNSGTTEHQDRDAPGLDSATDTFRDSRQAQDEIPGGTQKQEEPNFKPGPYDQEGNFRYYEKE